MKRNMIWWCGWVCSAGALLTAQPTRGQTPTDRPPNIIHIVVDDVGYDDIGCYGAKKIRTPNIDRLAADGARFTSFYAPAPLCSASRAAMITGCYAERVGIPGALMPHSTIGLSEQETTIGQALQSRGYATALIGKWHLGHHPRFLPTRHGFDVFFGLPYPNDQGAERNILPMHAKDPVRPPIPLWRGDQIEERSADLENLPIRFLNEALKFIDQNKDRPFFLHFANIETHVPWFIPSAYQGKSAAGAYGDAVEFMDWTVGQIMAYVQHLGLERRTLIVFNSDNGPLIRRGAAYEQTYGRFGTVDDTVQHALNGGKHTTWEGGARVACIAYWPGRIAPGGTIDSIAAGFDWPVTFAALAGTRMPDDRIIDGRDLTPLLTGQAGAAPVHEAFYYYHTFRLGGVRSGKWKLLISPTGSGFDSPTPGSAGMPAKGKGKAVVRPQLFDLEADLGETTDVSAREPEVMKRMMELAERARADLGDSATQRRGSGLREPGRIEN